MPGTLSRLLHDIGFDVFDDGHGLPVHVDFLPNVHHSRVVATNFTTSWGKCRTPYKGYKFCHGVEDDYCAEIAKLEYEVERDNGKEKICGCLGDYAGGQAFALCPQGVAKGAHGGNPLCSDGKGAVGNNRKFGEEFQPGDKITFLGRKCEEGKEIKCDE
eukprot:gnl/TRDRNA2_/TRDRNA2_170204_c0_seq6.p1 gnl/TRDRNA2_/TRDRNA2_170204_c0~~gnl/TRDRNA2_/TRDRNA2_170204_c0_seq6.p1  ORF type:complete len:159 (+),score=18.30 gnl/TRDRNA2_/TRDRNA2_170204_c0_seq6:65-541(+)